MTQVEEIRDIQKLDGIQEEWSSLLKKSESRSVFQTLCFIRAWWKAFGDSRNLHVVVFRNTSNKICLIAPLYSDIHDPFTLKVIGDFRGDYNNFIAGNSTNDIESFISWLEKKKNWRNLILKKIPENSILIKAFNEGKLNKQKKFYVKKRWLFEHPYIAGQKLLEYKSVLKKKKNAKRINELNQKGKLNYVSTTNYSELKKLLPVLIKLHKENWREKRKLKGLFENSKNVDFYNSLIEEFGESGIVQMNYLSLNDEIIAIHFGFIWSNQIYYYKPTYDISYSRYSPGKILLHYMLHEACENQIEKFDFLCGVEPYKKNYMSDLYKTGAILIYPSKIVYYKNRIFSKLGFYGK